MAKARDGDRGLDETISACPGVRAFRMVYESRSSRKQKAAEGHAAAIAKADPDEEDPEETFQDTSHRRRFGFDGEQGPSPGSDRHARALRQSTLEHTVEPRTGITGLHGQSEEIHA